MVNDYALLTRLPLLQGISSTDLLGWEDALRLEIDEFSASRMPLIRQGDNCSLLLWLVEGELQREHQSADGLFAVRSVLKGPALIEVDRLFGLLPTYQNTYTPLTDVRMLGIRKSLVGSHLMKNEVFRLNLLNLLSAIAQKRQTALMPNALFTAEERLIHFLRTLIPDGKGQVDVLVQMNDLADYIGETRLTVSRLLNAWQRQGSIRLGRARFTILDIEALLNQSHSHPSEAL